MLDLLAYVVAVLMTAIALWRFPAVLYGDSHRRALWGCYAGFAVALWIKSPAVKAALNSSSVTDLSVLLKHYASILAILAILNYVVASYGHRQSGDVPRHVAASRWAERTAYQASLGAMILMTVLFFTVVKREKPSVDFVAEHASQWGASLYMSVFYVYLGTAVVICGYQWFRAARRAETWLLRGGLALMAAGMAFGIAYTVCRTVFIWTAMAVPRNLDLNRALTHGTDILQYLTFILFAAGASIPAADSMAHRLRSWRMLWRLYPLWRDLMTALPGVGFAPPRSRLREMIRTSPTPAVRVDRWTQDIADCVDQLRHYAPGTLMDAAEVVAADHSDPQAAAEAYWINASLEALKRGERNPLPSEALPAKPISAPEAEAAWLDRVRNAYAQIPSEAGPSVLSLVEKSDL